MKNSLFTTALLFSFAAALSACTTQQEKPDPWVVKVKDAQYLGDKKIDTEHKDQVAPTPTPTPEVPESLWVWRADGSKKCSTANGMDPARLAKAAEKHGLHVLQFRKGMDGKAHAQICGGVTGKTVELQIPGTDLELAKKLGLLEKPQEIDNSQLSH